MMRHHLRACFLVCAAASSAGCRHENTTDAPTSAGGAATSGADSGTPAAGAGNGGSQADAAGSGAADTTPAAGSGGARAQASGLSFQAAMQSYQSWTRASAEPQPISVEIFSLCRAPSAAEQAFVESEHGKNLYLQDWLNPAAIRGRDAKAFEAGAAIVKQKLATGADGKLAAIALGVMIKRERGFDAAHGDWEFGYWEESPGLKAGAAEATHCGGCHASAPTDYVFLDQSWRK